MLFGRLAQLVEHPLDVREVTGSSPVSSTKKKGLPIGSPFFLAFGGPWPPKASGDFKRSAGMDPACAEVLPAVKRPYGANAPLARGPDFPGCNYADRSGTSKKRHDKKSCLFFYFSGPYPVRNQTERAAHRQRALFSFFMSAAAEQWSPQGPPPCRRNRWYHWPPPLWSSPPVPQLQ